MRLDTKSQKLFGSRFCADWIVATVKVSGNRQAGFGFGGANEAEDLLVAVEGFACPVLRNLREQAVLDGVPFRSAGRVVGDGERQAVCVGELGLKFDFPGAATMAVAASGVAQDEELSGTGIAERALLLLPMGDSVRGKGGGVV